MRSSSLTSSELAVLFELVGRVYDCAIEPERWQSTLETIRTFMNGANASIYGFDLSNNSIRFFMSSGVEPEWLARMPEYAKDVGALLAATGDIATLPIEQFHVIRRDVPDEVYEANRYVREWEKPQGICDLLQATLARTGQRFAVFSVARHESVGVITPREVEAMALLAPHLRRAVAISDLIDMKTVEANLFSEASNRIGFAMFLTDADARVLHCNRAAEALLEQGDGVALRHGKLRAATGEATRKLASAIAPNGSAGIEPGDPGTGIVLESSEEITVVAHVLPVAPGERPTRYAEHAVAAVIVQTSTARAQPDLSLFARAFGLTRAETDLLGRLVVGDDITMAGEALGIAKTTAKTHLARLFSKTGTNRQSVLVALANKLATAPLCKV